MLTKAQSIVEYRSGQAVPDRLTQSRHRHYTRYAREMLAIYREGIGRRRRTLHRQVEALFADEPDCPVRRIQAFCKLLDDKSAYHADAEGKASRLRLKVFSQAARFHPLVTRVDRLFENDEQHVKDQLAETLGLSWDEIDEALYADVMQYQRLESFDGYPSAAALLSRYNVAQLQACLYGAETMVVRAAEDFKTILRYAKLARLLHEIARVGPSDYRITLSGPASVLRETRRYGVNFARFLPALLSCRNWRATASLKTPWNQPVKLVLSDKDGFTAHLPAPEEFDSALEESLARKFGPRRDGWRLSREGAILHEHQRTFVPDFVFRHDDGTEVLLEIVGFWTPEYLAHKRSVLQQFRRHRVLMAVPEKSLRDEANVGANVLVYKTVLKLGPLMDALERIRTAHSRTV